MSHRTATVPRDAKASGGEAGDGRCPEISWDENADCRHCALRQQTLFAALRGSDFESIFLPIKSAIAPAGTILYDESTPADAVYTVRWGLVKLSKQAPEGGVRIVRLLGRGAAIGLEGLQEGVHWHTATTLQETGLCRVPFKVIDQLRAQNPQLVERLLVQWERHVQYADRWITELSTGSVKGRLHRLIDLLMDVTGNRSGEIEMPPVQDLAATIGVSVESVSRTMAELKRTGTLQRVAPRTYRRAIGHGLLKAEATPSHPPRSAKT